MKAHKKILSWITDYGYMIRGTADALVYRKAPHHYLGHVIEGKVPVVIIPGVLGRWGFMKNIGDKISLAGHPVYIVPDLGYNIYSIPSSASILRSVILNAFPKRDKMVPNFSKASNDIKKVIENNDLKGIILVAHSKGGLIGKYLLAHENKDNKVIGMISIATPYSGSAMANLVPLDPIQELRADSKIITDLEKHMDINSKIISICPEYDNHVWSENGSVLQGAENIHVPVHGHHKVIFDKSVQETILHAIEKITERNR